MRAHLPNLITLLNLACGILAVGALLYGELETGLICLGAAAIADFFDGLSARALGVDSPLGRELDSLADVVSFGLVPGIIFYGLIVHDAQGSWPNTWQIVGLPAILLPLSAALRLARYNLDERQRHGFIGLPTPATALFAAGLLLLHLLGGEAWTEGILHIGFLIPAALLLCLLMQANIPMFPMRIRSGAENRPLFLFLAYAFFLLMWQPVLAPLGWIAGYVIFSILALGKRKIL